MIKPVHPKIEQKKGGVGGGGGRVGEPQSELPHIPFAGSSKDAAIFGLSS
jgi:hypothetical protein